MAKILVAILARGNPVGLAALVGSLDALAANANEIAYVIRHDEDDTELRSSVDMLTSCMPNVSSLCLSRPSTLGAAWNEALAFQSGWDLAIPFPSDVVPIVEFWDAIAFNHAKTRPMFSWSQTCAPYLPMYPTFTRGWYEIVEGRVFPEWFPFWESDRWIWETYELAFGRPMPVMFDLILGGKRSPRTANMRDVEFWFSFYNATRELRVREAESIRRHFGTAAFDIAQVVREQEEIYKTQLARIPLYERTLGANPGLPSKEYLAAKARAVAWLADRPPTRQAA